MLGSRNRNPGAQARARCHGHGREREQKGSLSDPILKSESNFGEKWHPWERRHAGDCSWPTGMWDMSGMQERFRTSVPSMSPIHGGHRRDGASRLARRPGSRADDSRDGGGKAASGRQGRRTCRECRSNSRLGRQGRRTCWECRSNSRLGRQGRRTCRECRSNSRLGRQGRRTCRECRSNSRLGPAAEGGTPTFQHGPGQGAQGWLV